MPKQKLNILLIDDEKDEKFFFQEALDKLEIFSKLIYSNDAENAVNQMLTHNIHLVFADIHMHKISGLQFLKDMKASEKFNHIPIIMYTVSPTVQKIEEAYKSGAHYLIIKPHSMLNIVETLRKIFQHDWTQPQPIPPFDKFVINLAFA
jgi:DNA-binding NtrC family response regulator